MSKVFIDNIYAEDVFKWAFNHMLDSCGDGAATIVCENYEEAVEWFIKWIADNEPICNDMAVHKTTNFITCYRGQEGITFTNDKNIHSFDGDYVFIVTGDCKFGRDRGSYRKLGSVAQG